MTHPVISAIEARRQSIGMGRPELERRSGICHETALYIGRQQRPNFLSVEALANTVGLRLAVEPISREPIPFIRWSARR